MSRITLNLKKAGEEMSHSDGILSSTPKSLLFDRTRKRRRSSYFWENPSFAIASLPTPGFPAAVLSHTDAISGPRNELVFSHPLPDTPATMDSVRNGNESYFNAEGRGSLERRPAPVLILNSRATHNV